MKIGVLPNPNIINGRFMTAIKDIKTDKPYFKARFVAQEHRDCEKSSLINDTTDVRLSSIFVVFGMLVCPTNSNNAYLRSSCDLLIDVCLKSNKEPWVARWPSTQATKTGSWTWSFWELQAWNAWIARQKYLKINQSVQDISFFFQKSEEKLFGSIVTYEDNALITSDFEFLEHTDRTLKKLDSKDCQLDNSRFLQIIHRTK